jgi:rfaE bifunctional protein kinase chain/domain
MRNLSETIRTEFPKKKIVIAGDLVADQFLHGTIARVSREAPVFILRHDATDTLAGGAANAAVNVASLGGRPVVVGLVGEDSSGRLLTDRLRTSGVDCGHIVFSLAIQTTTKVRVLAGQHYAPRQQVIRIDYENTAEIGTDLRENLLANFSAAAEDADAVIVSDYGCGVADASLIECARGISKRKNVPLIVDSRFRLSEFRAATTATPNQEEVEQLLGKNFNEKSCELMRERLGYEALLVTRGNKGMLLLEKGEPPLVIDAVGATEPVDVTGAGDTVIAAYGLGLASGLRFREAAMIANHAGGIVVMKKGTAAASASEVLQSLEEYPVPMVSESVG